MMIISPVPVKIFLTESMMTLSILIPCNSKGILLIMTIDTSNLEENFNLETVTDDKGGQ